MLSCCEGLVEYYRVTGDESVLKAMVAFRDLVAAKELNACFSVGYNDQFAGAAALPDCITEPCDAIHWIRLNRELYLITGETKYVDSIEAAFYNAYLAGIGRDGKWGARGVRGHGYHHVAWHGQSGLKRQHCCVNNMPRTAVDVARTIAAHDAEGVLHVALYNDGKAEIGGDTVEISGKYPVGDKVTVKIARQRAGKVRFRIPAWSMGDRDRGTWRTVDVPAGESVHVLAFDMKPRARMRTIPAQTAAAEAGGVQDWRLRMWTGYGSDKDLAGCMRKFPAAEIMRGPMLLAKAGIAGTPAGELLPRRSVCEGGADLRLEPRTAQGTWGAWDLVVGGEKPHRIPVCDFISAGDDFKHPGVHFSVWF
jgi:hypothetical protein